MFEIKVITSILFITVLSGCTSPQSTYRAAKGEGSGYKDVALAENHYRVQFKINGASRKAAQKYALVRASELTIAQGYDWFVVEKRILRTLNEPDPFESAQTPIVTRTCGLLTCRNQTHLPRQHLDIPDTETLATMEIRMGHGVRPEQESYDAREIWEAQQKEKMLRRIKKIDKE